MKKIFGLFGLLTIFALFFTKSLYVELNEWIIITVFLTFLSIMVSAMYRKKGEVGAAKGSSAIIGFVLFWILVLFDLVADHFLYFLPTGNEDGRALTLGEKIQEYSDDLFIQFIVTFSIVSILSFVLSKLITKIIYKSA